MNLRKLFLLITLVASSGLSKPPPTSPSNFTDQDLKKLLQISAAKKTKGFIYIWSANMPLSIRGVKEARYLAKIKKLEFTALLDPQSDIKLASKIAKENGFPKSYSRRLESRTLLSREMTIHFPSTILFKNGDLALEMRGGYDDPERLVKFLEKEFEKIRGPASSAIQAQARGPFDVQPGVREPASATLDPKEKKAGVPAENLVCRFAPFGVIKRTAPRRPASYFFKSFPNSSLVSYAGVDNPNTARSSQEFNYILDLQTRAEFALPGPYDPVPICESLMTVPKGGQLKVYSISKILKKELDIELGEIPVDGVYQSASACPKDGVGEVRLITDDKGVTLVRLTVDVKSDPPKFTLLEKPKPICAGIDIKLPMLSKDGLEISGRDNDAGTSKVWKIEKDGSCTEVFNFGSLLGTSPDSKLSVGKADFSYDGKSLVFHVRSDLDDGKYFATPSENMAMNVYQYDRQKKLLRKITNNYDRNSYYPSFRADGSIVYFDQTRSGQISFVWLDPKQSPSISTDADYDEKEQRSEFKRYQGLMAIGRTWYEYCANQKEPLQVDTAVLTALSLDEDECKDLILKQWEKQKPEVLSKSLRDGSARGRRYSTGLDKWTAKNLIDLCPAQIQTYKEVEVLGDLNETLLTSAESILRIRCQSCHLDKPFGDPIALSREKKLIEEMIFRIFSAEGDQRMPAGSSLTQEEKDTVGKYLNAFIQGTIREPGLPGQAQGAYQKLKIPIFRPKALPPLNPGLEK